jgi:hypothetical protein
MKLLKWVHELVFSKVNNDTSYETSYTFSMGRKILYRFSWRYSKIQGVVLPNTVDQIISWSLHSQTRKTVFMSNHYTMQWR